MGWSMNDSKWQSQKNKFQDMEWCVNLLHGGILTWHRNRTIPNTREAPEHLAISWISSISIAKKQPYYAIMDTPENLLQTHWCLNKHLINLFLKHITQIIVHNYICSYCINNLIGINTIVSRTCLFMYWLIP